MRDDDDLTFAPQSGHEGGADYEPPTIVAMGKLGELTLGYAGPPFFDIGTSYFF